MMQRKGAAEVSGERKRWMKKVRRMNEVRRTNLLIRWRVNESLKTYTKRQRKRNSKRLDSSFFYKVQAMHCNIHQQCQLSP